MLGQQVQLEQEDLMVVLVTLVQQVNLVRQVTADPKVKPVHLAYLDLQVQKVQVGNKVLREFKAFLDYQVILDH